MVFQLAFHWLHRRIVIRYFGRYEQCETVKKQRHNRRYRLKPLHAELENVRLFLFCLKIDGFFWRFIYLSWNNFFDSRHTKGEP